LTPSQVYVLVCLQVYSGACLIKMLLFILLSYFRSFSFSVVYGFRKIFLLLFSSSIVDQLTFFFDSISVVDYEQMRLSVVYLCMCLFRKCRVKKNKEGGGGNEEKQFNICILIVNKLYVYVILKMTLYISTQKTNK